MGNDGQTGPRNCTVEMDSRGRITIPQPDRKALDIDGERALLDLEVSVLKSGEELEDGEGGSDE